MFTDKRVYEAAEASDGYRILVDRLWPRGMTKAALVMDDWLKELAPSSVLRKQLHSGRLDFAAFSLQYRTELHAQTALLQSLLARSRQGTVTLLYAARDKQLSHVQILIDVLRQLDET